MEKRQPLIIIAAIALVAIGVFVLLVVINPLDTSCSSNSGCVLAYTGLEQCAPCDSSGQDVRCVSLGEYEEMKLRRSLLVGPQALCKTCPAPVVEYKCICGRNGCEKTVA